MMRCKKIGVLFLAGSLWAGLGEAKDRPVTRGDLFPVSPDFKLAFPGPQEPIPYEKFGEFKGLGKNNYRYIINDKKGLSEAAGEGIFPNEMVRRDPIYKELVRNPAFMKSHWEFTDNPDPIINFFKWSTTAEDPGVKQFYTAVMLERLGRIEDAIKAYYAVGVHFPKTTSYTYYNTPWSVGPSALDRVEQLLRRYPKIKWNYDPGRIFVHTRYDNNSLNDKYEIDPGTLTDKKRRKNEKPVNLSKLKITKRIGGDRTQLVQFENGHWQFRVNGEPFPIRAITYSVTPIGASPDRGTWNASRDWQVLDTDKDGVHDGFFEAFVDKNRNNKQDADEPTVGDAQLLKDAGFNTLRAYHHIYNRDLFRKLQKDYGIYVLGGDLFGMYAVGSGANWADGTDYTDPQQQETLLAGVRKFVEEYMNEDFILMWVIGNENVYGVANNSDKKPEAYFQLVNRAAKMIKEIDPSRPIAISNGDLLYLDVIAKECPDVDIIGANAYRGEYGFGRHFYSDVYELTGKPVLITEYGAPAMGEGYTREQQEAYQSMYILNNWEDLEAHMAGHGVGNALGGVLFEYLDEWWKANSDLPEEVQKQKGEWYAERSAIYKNLQPENQDSVPQFGFPMLDGWSYEEWYGIAGQGNGKASPFSRQLRQAYFDLKEMWNK